MSQSAADGCGQPGHPADCVCDVLVDEPTRIGSRRVHYIEIIARAMGVDFRSLPREQQVDMLIKVLNAHEAMVRVSGQGMHRVINFKAKRNQLATYLRQGGKMSEVEWRTDLEWHDVINILTQAKQSRLWVWTADDWDRFEKVIRANPKASRAIAEDFGIALSTAQRFWKLYYGSPPT